MPDPAVQRGPGPLSGQGCCPPPSQGGRGTEHAGAVPEELQPVEHAVPWSTAPRGSGWNVQEQEGQLQQFFLSPQPSPKWGKWMKVSEGAGPKKTPEYQP